MNKWVKKALIILFFVLITFCLLFISTTAFAKVETITKTVKQSFGGSQSPDDARIAAITRAKREALEEAGTYIESITVVKNSVLEKDEILALAAGVLKTEIVSQKNYVTGDIFGIEVVAKIEVDTSVLEERVEALLNDRDYLKKYHDSKKHEKELLARIRELEEQNRKLKISTNREEKERLKEDFNDATKELTANELYEKALALSKNNSASDMDKIIEYLHQAIKLDPSHGNAYGQIGTAYSDKDDYDKAIEYYQKAVNIFNRNGSSNNDIAGWTFMIGNAYYFKDDYGLALKHYQKALKVFIDIHGYNHEYVGSTIYSIGRVYSAKGDSDLALEQFLKAFVIFLNTKEADAEEIAFLLSYGVNSVLNNEGQYIKVREYYQKALKISIDKLGSDHPCVAETYYHFALILPREDPKSEQYMKEAIRITPNDTHKYMMLSIMYENEGRYSDAIDINNHSIRIKPDNKLPYISNASIYKKINEHQKAIESYKKLLRIDPNDYSTHFSLATLYWELNRYLEAVEHYKHVIRINPDYVPAHSSLGIIYLLLDDKSSAIDEYRILKDLDSKFANELFEKIYP